jgi:DNA polymerase-3 subunit alpha
MVHDILDFARRQSILVGPGRGSSAGSLLAFCLEITQVDPIRHGLFFERFLNKDRVSPPDIDVDVADSGRQQVLAYVRETFGNERVAHIGSYSTLGPRQAIRDVVTVHGWSDIQIGQLLKTVPDDPMLKFEDVAKMSSIRNGLGEKLLKTVSALAGKNRHNSTHAAGVIVSNGNLEDELPLKRDKEGHTLTLYSYDELSKLGYIKFDILGLTTLGIIDRVCQTATVDMKKLWSMEDSQTYDLLCRGESIGVFQLEGYGYQKFIKRYRPREFEDLMMINALYRPGPMQGGDGLDTILRRRDGQEEPQYIDMALEPLLRWTYGMPVYQEQIMQICVELAGFTLSEADSMRSAIGKKKEEEIAALKDKFIRGCVAKNRTRDVAGKLYNDIEFFARYGWNKAHAAAYGMVTFATAYLKTHHPAHFMAETMNSASDPDRMKMLIFETRRLGIRFEKPHVNVSAVGYSVPRNLPAPYMSIASGLSSVKGVGEKAASAVLEARGTGKFYSLDELRERIPRKVLNSRMWELLDMAGALAGLPKAQEDVPF